MELLSVQVRERAVPPPTEASGPPRVVRIVPQSSPATPGDSAEPAPLPAGRRPRDKVIGHRSFPGAMRRPLEGRVALVTGSTGQGMGRSIALTLAREGADIVLNFGTNRTTREADHRRLIKAIEDLGARAVVVRADTADGGEVRAMFALAKRALGPVDILVNNAGGQWDPSNQDLATIKDEFWQEVLRAEIDGMFHTIKAALPSMRRKRWGRIVNLGMERSEEFMEPPYDYTVGKIARHGLTRILSEVEIRHGITLNAVAPGYIPYFTFRQAIEAVRRRGPWAQRKYGTPQDVAEVVAFLCSDAARNVNGAIIPVHGAPY